ncbi:hypothetical protein [Ramlibacter agri]|nr:hypothetical protein [Ramlibacter agri]
MTPPLGGQAEGPLSAAADAFLGRLLLHLPQTAVQDMSNGPA